MAISTSWSIPNEMSRGERPVGPGDVRAAERVADPCRRLGRPYDGKRVPLDEEMPGPVVQGDDRVRLGGELNQDPVPDELQHI